MQRLMATVNLWTWGHNTEDWSTHLNVFCAQMGLEAFTAGWDWLSWAQEWLGDLISSCIPIISFLFIHFVKKSIKIKYLFPSFSYDTIKAELQEGDMTRPLGPTLHMAAASSAGLITLVLTNPIYVVKTRLCLQFGPNPQCLSEEKRYKYDVHKYHHHCHFIQLLNTSMKRDSFLWHFVTEV